MAMTEKQGGSDVRANTTRAMPIGRDAMGEAYELVGHKFFVSAPMCDAFLTLAQAPGGLTCFLAPRWRPDGTKNPIEFVRLKRKMGNVSNASSETEWRGALAWRVGPEGRGVATIIEMVGDDALRLHDRLVGRHAHAPPPQAIDHCRQRKAFGALLIDQPIMRAVLADLALEAEAALALTLRVARALDDRAADAREDAFARIAAPLGKYWICKRAPAARLRGDGMHRRLRRDGGFADAAPLSRGADQRDLGRQRQRAMPRRAARDLAARRRRWTPISPRSTPRAARTARSTRMSRR